MFTLFMNFLFMMSKPKQKVVLYFSFCAPTELQGFNSGRR